MSAAMRDRAALGDSGDGLITFDVPSSWFASKARETRRAEARGHARMDVHSLLINLLYFQLARDHEVCYGVQPVGQEIAGYVHLAKDLARHMSYGLDKRLAEIDRAHGNHPDPLYAAALRLAGELTLVSKDLASRQRGLCDFRAVSRIAESARSSSSLMRKLESSNLNDVAGIQVRGGRASIGFSGDSSADASA